MSRPSSVTRPLGVYTGQEPPLSHPPTRRRINRLLTPCSGRIYGSSLIDFPIAKKPSLFHPIAVLPLRSHLRPGVGSNPGSKPPMVGSAELIGCKLIIFMLSGRIGWLGPPAPANKRLKVNPVSTLLKGDKARPKHFPISSKASAKFGLFLEIHLIDKANKPIIDIPVDCNR